MCVPPFKGDRFYFLETKCLAKSLMENVPTIKSTSLTLRGKMLTLLTIRNTQWQYMF